MSPLRIYLAIIYVCLSLTYIIDIVEHPAVGQAVQPQLIMLAFVNISVVLAFFSGKLHGQALLFVNFIFIGVIPLALGILSHWTEDPRTIRLFKLSCVGIPLVLLLFPFMAAIAGIQPAGEEPWQRVVFSRLIQAVYWYAVFMYVRLLLKDKLQAEKLP